MALLTPALADNHDDRTIKEAWGDEAKIGNCFTNNDRIGTNNGGTSGSDIQKLVQTDQLTFSHKVSAIRVCTLPPLGLGPESLIQSVQLFLSIDDHHTIELDTIGFECCACRTQEISGDLLQMEMYFIPDKGIHRLTVTDTNGFHSFGPEDSSAPEKAVIRFTDRYDRPMGFYGSWKFDGLTSLGLITMNT